MPKAYAIAHVTMINLEKFTEQYGSKIEDTIKAFGGMFLVRGGSISYTEGEKLGDLNVVVEFPDIASALAWNNSYEYQAILPGRTQNAITNFIIIDGVA
jgi:uncharacterized protein (DUF1330 family)